MTTKARVAAFDAYGTLFDVHSAARHLAPRLGEHHEAVSRIWRQKQLEYTWLRALMKSYADFWTVTQDALDYAMSAVGLEDAELRAALLEVYERLDAYDDAAGALDALRARGLKTAILSNGAPNMLRSAVLHAGLADRLDAVLTVDVLGTYKPDPPVYDLPSAHFEVPREEVVFTSANAWDVAGAASAGLTVVWVNRFGQPPERIPGRSLHTIERLADLEALFD